MYWFSIQLSLSLSLFDCIHHEHSNHWLCFYTEHSAEILVGRAAAFQGICRSSVLNSASVNTSGEFLLSGLNNSLMEQTLAFPKNLVWWAHPTRYLKVSNSSERTTMGLPHSPSTPRGHTLGHVCGLGVHHQTISTGASRTLCCPHCSSPRPLCIYYHQCLFHCAVSRAEFMSSTFCVLMSVAIWMALSRGTTLHLRSFLRSENREDIPMNVFVMRCRCLAIFWAATILTAVVEFSSSTSWKYICSAQLLQLFFLPSAFSSTLHLLLFAHFSPHIKHKSKPALLAKKANSSA